MNLKDFKIFCALILGFFVQLTVFYYFYYFNIGFVWLSPFLYLLCGFLYILIRKDLRDPTGILLVGTGLYVFLPTIGSDINDYLRWNFKFSDAYYVSNISALSLLFSVIVCLFFKPKIKLINLIKYNDYLLDKIKIYGVFISILLASIFLMKNGFLFLDSTKYLEGFENRGQAGTGILMLALPFAMISLSVLFLSEKRVKFLDILIFFLPYIILFMATAQRRYFITPFLIWLACKVKVTFKGVIMALSTTLSFYYIFLYLGYLRINDLDIKINNIINNHDAFLDVFPDLIAGETLLLYATQGSAFANIIKPLPLFGDYFLAPLMSLPNFIFGKLYIPMNTKFSEYVTPLTASQGGGWGFSYAAEGYVVGKELGIIISSLLICFIFRFIWVYSSFNKGSLKIMNIMCICSLFTALFFYRNSFSYAFKDLFYLFLCLIFLVIMSSFLTRINK